MRLFVLTPTHVGDVAKELGVPKTDGYSWQPVEKVFLEYSHVWVHRDAEDWVSCPSSYLPRWEDCKNIVLDYFNHLRNGTMPAIQQNRKGVGFMVFGGERIHECNYGMNNNSFRFSGSDEPEISSDFTDLLEKIG